MDGVEQLARGSRRARARGPASRAARTRSASGSTARPPAVTRRRARSSSRSPATIRSSGRAARLGAPQDRADARDELLGAERLDDVVVGAELQAGDPVGLVAARGEDDDRDASSRAGARGRRRGRRPSAGRGPGRSRPAGARGRARARPRRRRAVRTAKPGVLEVVADEGGDLGLVLDDEDGAHGAPETATTPGEDTRPASRGGERASGAVGGAGGSVPAAAVPAARPPPRGGGGGRRRPTGGAGRRRRPSGRGRPGQWPWPQPGRAPQAAPAAAERGEQEADEQEEEQEREEEPEEREAAGQTTVPPAAPMLDAMPAWKPMTPPTRATMVARMRVEQPAHGRISDRWCGPAVPGRGCLTASILARRMCRTRAHGCGFAQIDGRSVAEAGPDVARGRDPRVVGGTRLRCRRPGRAGRRRPVAPGRDHDAERAGGDQVGRGAARGAWRAGGRSGDGVPPRWT